MAVLSKLAEDLFDGHDRRRRAHDAPFTVHNGGELAQCLGAVVSVCLGQHRLRGLDPLGLDVRFEVPDRVLDVEMRVPNIEQRLLGESAHGCPVGLPNSDADLASHLGREAALPPGDREACGETLDVPLEWTRKRLVEVIDVEYQAPRRRGKPTEVRQVGIPAQLGAEPGRRCVSKIDCHRQCGATKEGEGRDQHPAVPDRDQFRHPRRCLRQ